MNLVRQAVSIFTTAFKLLTGGMASPYAKSLWVSGKTTACRCGEINPSWAHAMWECQVGGLGQPEPYVLFARFVIATT